MAHLERSAEEMISLAIIITILAIVALLVVRTVIPSDSDVIARWAAEEEFTLLEAKHPSIRLGPSMFPHTEGVVYAIAVEDREGKRMEGWLCIPSGQWTKSRVDVCWKTGGFISLTPGVTTYRLKEPNQTPEPTAPSGRGSS